MIGELNKRIVVQHPTLTPDGMGGMTKVYSDADTIWSALWPVKASERVQSDQATMTATMRIRIRYRSKFLPSWRLRFGNRFFNVVSIINQNERNQWLDLMCEEAT